MSHSVLCKELTIDIFNEATSYYCKLAGRECSVPATGVCEVGVKNVESTELSSAEIAKALGLNEAFPTPHAMLLPVLT